MHFLAALLLFADLIWLSQAKTTGINANKDSTILLTNNGCPQCLHHICAKCTLGTADSLHANATPEHLSRILVGFTLAMPAYQITRCTLHTSRIVFNRKSSFNVNVYAAGTTFWDEETVGAEKAPIVYQIIDTVTVAPDESFIGPIDLTASCQSAAADGRFAIYLAPVDTSFYLWSQDKSSEHMMVVEYEE